MIYYNNEIAKETKYPGYYCTKSGKVITIKVKGGRGKIDPNNPREYRYKLDKDGYLEVCLSSYSEGKQKRIYRRVHRLVWETFNGEIENDLTVDHIDFNKSNNDLSNLQLLSRVENGIKRRKEWVKERRFKFRVFHDDVLIGEYDRFDLKELYGFNVTDFNKFNKGILTNRVKHLKEKGITLEKV